MHYLTRQRLHLSRFHPLMKALLTLYIASVAAAVWVGTLKYSERGTFSPSGASTYVRGADAGGGTPATDTFGDPFAGTPEGIAQLCAQLDSIRPKNFRQQPQQASPAPTQQQQQRPSQYGM